MKKLIALVLALVCVLGLVGCTEKDYYGIGLQFDSGASKEYVQAFIEKYNADTVFQDEHDPNYYKLVFYNKSEQEVIKLTNELFKEEYVVDATCIQIASSELDDMK